MTVYAPKKTKRILVLPDHQIPYHDKKFVKALIDFTGEYQADEVHHIGDFGDQPEPSRWNKGSAAEYAPTLQAGLDECHNVMAGYREAYDGPMFLKEGNHDLRIGQYVRKYAPALASLRGLDAPTLYGLDKLDVKYMIDPYDIAPGWRLMHLHEQKGYSNIPGGTARNAAIRYNMSVIGGHTHKLAAVPFTRGVGRSRRTMWGVEVGHAMNQQDAQYLGDGYADWQQGCVILYVVGNNVHPHPVPVVNRTFIVEGKEYKF